MKLKINKILGVIALATLLYSCDTTNETGYTPAVYTSPATFTITEDATASSDNSFGVTYNPTSEGKGYYVVVPAGTAAPTSTQVHGGAASFQQAGSFDVDGSTPVDILVDSAIFGAYTYDVYAIHKSTDNFISETVTKLTVTTPDTAAPVFVRDNTTPAHNVQPGANSSFTAINLAFSEPVFYQGGDIIFTGFFSGRTITVSDPAAITMNGTTISIADHGTFAPDDAILVTWEAGTFKDNSGKSVDALSGFGYYFWTRDFTIAEKAKLTPGMYNYTTQFYGGLSGFYSGLFAGNPGVFLPDAGTFEIVADDTDATGHTLKGINLFSGFGGAESETLPIVINPTVADELDLMPNVPSVITANGISTYWSHYGGSFFGLPFTLPGFYDFDAGTITHYVSLYFSDDDSALDDIDYLYTRIGTYARGQNSQYMSMDELVRLSNSMRKESTKSVRSTNAVLNY